MPRKSQGADRQRSRGFRLVVGALVLATLLALFGLGIFPQEWLRSFVESRLRQATTARSGIRELRVVPGMLRAEVEGMVIVGPTYRIEVPRARLRLLPGFLLGQAMAFQTVELERPTIVLRPAAEPTTPKELLKEPLVVRSLLATEGTVSYVHPDQGEIILKGVTLRGSIGEGDLELWVREGSWERERPVAIDGAHGTLRVSSRLDVVIRGLETTIGRSHVRLAGTLGRLGRVAPDLTFEGRVDLADAVLFQEGWKARGRVDARGRYRQHGEDGAVEAEAEVSGTDLEVADLGIEVLEGKVSRAASGAARVEARIDTLGGRADLSGTADRERVDGRIEARRLDVAALLRQLGVKAGGASGRLDADATVEGPLGGRLRVDGRFRGDGRAAVADLGLKASGTVKGTVDAKTRALDVGWSALVDARALAAGAVLRDAHLEARGTARGAGTPAVDARLEGQVTTATALGVERSPLHGTVRARGERVALDLEGRAFGGDVHADVQLRGARAERALVRATGVDLARLAPESSGTVDVTADLAGTVDALGGTAELVARDVVYRGAAVGPVTGRLTGRGGAGRFTVAVPELGASGEGRMDRRSVDATVDLRDTPLAPLAPLATPGRRLEGEATGRLRVQGRWNALAAARVEGRMESLHVVTDTLDVRTRQPFDVSGRNRVFTVRGLDLEGQGLSLTASGTLGFAPGAPLDLQGQATVDLTRVPAPPGWTLTGTAHADLALAGTFDDPRARGTVRLSGVTAARPDGRAVTVEDGTIELQDDVLATSGLVVEVGGGRLVLTGRAPVFALLPETAERWRRRFTPGTFDLRAEVQPIDLARLPVPAGWTVTGTASGDLSVVGTLEDPVARGIVRVSGVTVALANGRPVRLHDGTIELQDDVVFTSGLVAEVGEGRLVLSGRAPLAALLPASAERWRRGLAPGTLDVRAEVQPIDLSVLPVPAGWTVTGTAAGEVTLAGTLEAPVLSGLLALRDAAAQGPGLPLVTASGEVRLTDDAVSTSRLDAQVADGTVTVEGRLPLVLVLPPGHALGSRLARGEADLRASWRDLQVARFLEARRPDRPSPVSATISGQATLRGSAPRLDALSGEVQLAASAVRVRDQDLDLQLQPVTFRVQDGTVGTDALVLQSEQGGFQAAGSLDLRRGTVAGTGRGELDLRTLSPLLEEAALSGAATVDVRLDGTLRQPNATGSVEVRDATLRVRDIPQPITAINGRLTLEDRRVILPDLSGRLGGGSLVAIGSAEVEGLGVRDVQVRISGRDVALLYPVGGRRRAGTLGYFKARARAEMNLTGRTGDLRLSGEAFLERGLYDAPYDPAQTLLAPELGPDSGPPSRLLQSIALELAVATENPVVVRNNLARLEATGAWWVRGDLAEPAPYGRLDLRAGGKVFLQTREFDVTAGSLIYTGTMDPELNVTAQTFLRPLGSEALTVTVRAAGTMDDPRLTLSSSPARTERELAALIATGRSDVALGSSAWIVGEQAALLLTNRFTRQVAEGLRDLGFDEVDIQPDLLAREGEPGARFTFGKQISEHVKVVYSSGLNNVEKQYYQLQYAFRPGREAAATIRKQEEGGWSYGLGQSLRFGGPKRPPEQKEYERVELAEVRLEGDLGLPEARLGEVLKVKPGKEVLYWDLLDDADRLRERLVENGYLEAVIDARLEGTTAVFFVAAGEPHDWHVEGMANPPDLTSEIRRSFYDEEALERGRARLLDELHRRGHLKAEVTARETEHEDHSTLLFTVKPGPVLRLAEARFPGATVFTPDELVSVAGGPAALVGAPRDVALKIRDAYRQRHYLGVKVEAPQVSEEGGAVRVTVPVEEGVPAVVASVRFPGATLPFAELQDLAAVPIGEPYDQALTVEAVQRVRDRYLKLGYAAVRVTPAVNPVGTDVEIAFNVREGQRSVVGPVTIKGLRRTSRGLVQGRIDAELKPGEPLDPRHLAALERRLLDTGAFSRVVVTAAEGEVAPITVEVEEQARYRVAWDLRFSDSERTSGLLDGEVGNLFGSGVALGGRYRGGGRVQEQRASLHFPSFLGGTLTAAVFNVRQDVGPGTDPQSLAARELLLPLSTVSERGLSLQQARHGHPWDILYGYRYKRVESLTETLVDRFLEDVAAVDVSAVLDTREDPLNPRRGLFLALNVQVSPQFLGSTRDFAKVLAQGSVVRRLTPALTWAQGLRVGVAAGRIGTFTERFRAGGSNSIRGFGTDEVGPRNAKGEPLGGNALVVLNEELRYMTAAGYGGAVFYDAGNVFRRATEFSLAWRHALGAGLRWESPIGLVRLDVGFALNRRQGDRWHRVYFGLGQAF